MLQKLFIISILFSFSLFAQEFKLKSLTGETFDINMTASTLSVKEFPNKVIILDFFSTTCPPCIQEFPELIKVQEVFKESVQIIGIQSASKKDDKAILEFANKHKLNYPIINLDEAGELINFALEHGGWMGALPFKLLYHSRGTLSYRLYGAMTWKKLTGALSDL